MFASRPTDPATGLINMRARWYSPDIGRFLSPDPAGLVDGTNLYAYAQNDPLNFFDPSGLARQATQDNPGLGKSQASLLSRIRDQLRAFVRGETALNGEQIAALIHRYAEGLGEALLDSLPGGSGLFARANRRYAAGLISSGVSAIDVAGNAVATMADPSMLVRGILRLGEGTAMGVQEIQRGNWVMGASMITAEVAAVVGMAAGGVGVARGGLVAGAGGPNGAPRGTRIYRGMKDAGGTPKTGPTARTLSVRPGTDIPIDASGMVKPGTGGMSVSPSPRALPRHRRPPELGGTGKDPVWSMSADDLGPDLVHVSDSPTHGTVQPARPMSLEAYQEALCNTAACWSRL